MKKKYVGKEKLPQIHLNDYYIVFTVAIDSSMFFVL